MYCIIKVKKMSMNLRNLIIPMIFILFLCIGVASASDMEDISNPNMVLTDENHLADNSMENNLNDNSIEGNSLIDNSNGGTSSSEDIAIYSSNVNDDNLIPSNAVKESGDASKTVQKSKTKITAKKVKAYYKEKSQLKISLKDSKNKALKNKSIKISINHKTYTRTTNGLGQIALKLNLKPNKYNVKISFDGDNDYCASYLRTVVNIKKAPLSIKTANSKSYYYPDTFFKAKVINKITKKPVEGVKVLFKVYSSKNKYKNYYAVTDEKGIATLNKRLKTGKYKVYSFIKAKKQLFSYKNKAKKAILTVMNTSEMGCSSIYVYLNENESAMAFRRDSTYGASLYVVAKKWYGRTAVKQYKLTGTYFFHAITTSDGWHIGTGGWDNPTVNKKIEKLAGKMVSSNKISKSLLNSVLYQERKLPTGHFAIVAPNGRYAVLWRGGYIKGKLKEGEYLKVPNIRSLFRHGNYRDFSDNVSEAALKIAAKDPFGINRRNIMTYHYKRVTKDYKTNASVTVYGANDKGNLLGRYTAGLRDNVYFKKKFISKFKLFGTPKQKLIGKHKFGNIDKIIKTPTKLYVKNFTADYNQSKYFKLTLKNKKTKNVLKNVRVKLRIYTGKKYKDYYVKTDVNGVAKFNTNILKIGNHKVLISPGNNKYLISGKIFILINELIPQDDELDETLVA